MFPILTFCILLGISQIHGQQTLSFVISAKGLPSGDKENIGSIVSEGVGTLLGPSHVKQTSDSDPYVKVYASNGDPSQKVIIGQSANLKDNNDPAWNDVFTFEWRRGTGQKWHFAIFDHDIVDDHDPIGEATMDIDDYVSSGEDKSVALSEGGTLTVKKDSAIFFKISVRELPSKDHFGTDDLSDPYVKIYYRNGADGKDSKFYETKTIDNVREWDWDEKIKFNSYQRGKNQYLRFKVKDSDTFNKDQDIGEALLELDSFVSKNAPQTLSLGNEGGTITIKPE